VYATAVALTTGTFTPIPTAYVTPFVVVPSPPAENILTAAARTEPVAVIGNLVVTPTPFPHNAVLGEWITATPTPLNVMTAAAYSAAATESARTYGAATPTPFHWLIITSTPLPMATATPTLPPIVLSEDFTPTPIPTATEFVPDTLPAEFLNLIFFQKGTDSEAEAWVYDPTTKATGRITRSWMYPMARKILTLAPNGDEEVFVRTDNNEVAQIVIRSHQYGTERQITSFTRDSYDPAWSSTGEWIAFVSSITGNDEIYRIRPDGSGLEQLTHNDWEWDKHPSWSPDGSQIVFFSNRETGRSQLWLMNADGSAQTHLLITEDDDLYPVWTR
jgi:hypothetical protein